MKRIEKPCGTLSLAGAWSAVAFEVFCFLPFLALRMDWGAELIRKSFWSTLNLSPLILILCFAGTLGTILSKKHPWNIRSLLLAVNLSGILLAGLFLTV